MREFTLVTLTQDQFILAFIDSSEEERKKMKTELEEKYDFLDTQDYQIKWARTSACIVVQGKSLVVRALWAVPQDSIVFSSDVERHDYEKAKMRYPIRLNERECFAKEIKAVTEASNNFYDFLKEMVVTKHQEVDKQTPVMQQLNADIVYIDQQPEDIWVYTKWRLLIASVYEAYKKEKKSPTIFVGGGLSDFFQKQSLLLPKYKSIFDEAFGENRWTEKPSQGSAPNQLIDLNIFAAYYAYLNTKRNPMAAVEKITLLSRLGFGSP